MPNYVPGSLYKYGRPLLDTDPEYLALNSQNDLDRQIENYATRIQYTGNQVPPPKKDTNLLFSALHALDKPRNAIWNAIEDVAKGENDFLQGLKEGWTQEEEYRGSDLMKDLGIKNKIARGVLGFGAEVLGDPLTFVTTGVGGLAKGALTRTGGTLGAKGATALGRAETAADVNRKLQELKRQYNITSTEKLAKELFDKGIIKDPSKEAVENFARRQTFGDDIIQQATKASDAALNKATKHYLDKYKVNSKEELVEKLGLMERHGLTQQQALNVIDNMIARRAFGKDFVDSISSRLSTMRKAPDTGTQGIRNAIYKASRRAPEQEDLYLRYAQDLYQAKKAKEGVEAFRETAGTGVSVFGKEIVPGWVMRDIGARMGEKLYDAPVIGKAMGTLHDAAGRLFSPPYIMGLDASERAVIKLLERRARGEEQVMNQLEKARVEQWAKGLPQEAEYLIPKVIEGRATKEELKKYGEIASKVMKEMEQELRRIGVTESSMGVVKSLIENYFPHKLSWELFKPGKALKLGGKTRNLNIMNYSNIKRKYGNDLDKANKALEKKFGIPNMLETSALKAYLSRALEHNRIIADKKFIDDIKNAFGEKVTRSNINKLRGKGYTIVVPAAKFNLFVLPKDMASAMYDASELANKTEKAAKEINKRVGTLKQIETRFKKYGLSKRKGKAQLQKFLVSDDTKKLLDELKEKNIKFKVKDRHTRAIQHIAESESVLKEINPDADEFIFAHYKELGAFALPTPLYNKINNAGKRQIDAGLDLLQDLFGAFYRIWTPTVTGLRPTYHMRNLIGGQFQNFLDTGFRMFSPKIQKAATKLVMGADSDTVNLGGKTYTIKEIRELMTRHGALNTFFRADTNTLKETIMEETRFANRAFDPATAIKSAPSNFVKGGKFVGNKVEEYNRGINFMAHLDKGMPPEQAAEMTRRYQFDYTDITEVERKLKKVFPFYTWVRKNMPLMLEEFLNKPGIMSAFGYKLPGNMAEATGVDLEGMPEWMQKNLAIPFGKGKDGRVAALDVGLPLQDINQLAEPVDMAINMLTPLVKAPIELAKNTNFLTGAPLQQFPEQTAQRLIRGEGVPQIVGDVIKSSPVLQELVMANPGLTNAIKHIIDQFGVFRDVGRFATNSAQPPDSATISSKHIAHTDSALVNAVENVLLDPGFLKYYSPEKVEESKKYERLRQLSNVIQALRDMGVDVPTMTDIKQETLQELGYMPSLRDLVNQSYRQMGIDRESLLTKTKRQRLEEALQQLGY